MPLQGAHDALLVFRRHPGVYADAWREPEQIFIGHGFQLLAFHYPGARVGDNAQL